MYNEKFENVPDIFGAPGLAVVVVAVKMLARLGIASVGMVTTWGTVTTWGMAHMPNHGELMDDVHVHDPMHVSVFVHVISCYLHSLSCQLVCLVNSLC